MGVGIAAMRFTGMHAMEMFPAIEYTPWKVAISVVVAIAASMAALWLAFTLRTTGQDNLVTKRLSAAFVMAIAITGMHYIGMDAANFAAGSLCLSRPTLNANWLALAVTATSFTVLVGTLALLSCLTILGLRSTLKMHALFFEMHPGGVEPSPHPTESLQTQPAASS